MLLIAWDFQVHLLFASENLSKILRFPLSGFAPRTELAAVVGEGICASAPPQSA